MADSRAVSPLCLPMMRISSMSRPVVTHGRWRSNSTWADQVGFARGIEEWNHDRPHRETRNHTLHKTFLAFAHKNEALTI
jgi:hypothetical protein